MIEGIKRNEIYAGGISFQIATCDLRCVDRYDNNPGSSDMVYSTLQETERKYLGFAQPEGSAQILHLSVLAMSLLSLFIILSYIRKRPKVL